MANEKKPVGYANPPEATKFRKGDGRPRGHRPKGSRNKKTVAERFMEIAEEALPVNEKGKPGRRASPEIVFKKLRNFALTKDDSKLMERFLDRYTELEKIASSTKTVSYPFSVLDRQVMDEMFRRMKRCEQDGDE